jgi:hypothetical protein
MVATAEAISQLSIQAAKSIEIDAPLEAAFEELLEQIGPANVTLDGTPMPMKAEPWPCGRWFRNLGQEDGHSGDRCRRSKGPSFLKSRAHSLCPTPSYSMSSFDWYR